jgi:hypothetical protein
VLFIWLAACRAAPPAPTQEPPVPTQELSDGWVQVETAEFSLLLPVTWEAHEVTPENASGEFESMKKINPQLAANLSGSTGMQEISLWAYDAGGSDAGFHDNMNVFHMSLGGEKVDDLQSVLDLLVKEYARGGAKVTESEQYRVEDHPALRVAYNYSTPVSGGRVARLEGRQYFFVVGDSVWILSFTIDPVHLDDMTAVVERCAESFHALE